MTPKQFLKFLSRKGPLRVLKRLIISIPRPAKNIWRAISWSFSRTEDSNFYYNISSKNKNDLASLLALVLKCETSVINEYFREIESDETFRRILRHHIAINSGITDTHFALGRRLGWYAIVRHQRPRTVLETGVHQGLGALAICIALEKNRFEGFQGTYFGTDLDMRAGALLPDEKGEFVQILYGDSIEKIKSIQDPIDLYISDSDHSQEYEHQELLTVSKKLSKYAMVIADNAHSSEVLRDWSNKNNRNYVFFSEKPEDHWYEGGGIGLSWSIENS